MLPSHIPRYPAPAKLNLDLRITGRRSNGYHDLESIFTLIDWCDYIGIAVREDGCIALHTPTQGVASEDDLTVRAARTLQSLSGSLKGADIWIEKHIPMGGGLGGGSSDAATVLLALNRLWQCGLNTEQLIQAGVQLGADVPFFLFGRTAFARGVGEILQAIDVPKQYYLIACPDVHVCTADVFRHPDLRRNSPPCAQPGYQALQPLRNDMQPVVEREYPQVAQAVSCLKEYGSPQLTGSGACVFLTFDTREQVRSVQKQLPAYVKTYCASALPEHPIFQIM